MDERPSLEERYARAINSHHLEVDERRAGDVDVLIAAGWVPEHLGTMLYRLSTEFDVARGDQAISRRNEKEKGDQADELGCAARRHERAASASARAAARLRKRDDYERWLDVMILGSAAAETAADLVKQEAALRTEIVNDARMARAFILLKLKTLAQAREAIGEWALIRAGRERFMSAGPFPSDMGPAQPERIAAWLQAVARRNATVAVLAGRVLDVFLDDICDECQGRGFNGGYRKPQIICGGKTGCSGTGRRSRVLGRDERENQFARALLNSMQVLVDHASRSMRGFLSQREMA